MPFHPRTTVELIIYFASIFLISLIDFAVIIRSKFSKHYKVLPNSPDDYDFSILVPIFGDISYLKNIEFLKQYAGHVILCTTTKESEEFNMAVRDIADQYKFRIFRSAIPLSSRHVQLNPWTLFTHTLQGRGGTYEKTAEIELGGKINKTIERDEIIRDSFSAVKTKYCIYLDGDTVAREKLHTLAHRFRESKLDLASVRVLVSRRDTIMEKLQWLEYQIAMDARKVYPWLTSGAAMISTTHGMKKIMSHHSLFFSGGDIEIGKLAKMLYLNVGHIDFNFFTDVPKTFTAWFKQRRIWFGGGFRHAVINLHQFSWRNPLFYFYTTILVYLMTPFRIYEIIRYPAVLGIIIVLYWLLALVFHWKHRDWYFFLVPFYALIQILILVPYGAYTYFMMARDSNNVGLIKFRDEPIATSEYAEQL